MARYTHKSLRSALCAKKRLPVVSLHGETTKTPTRGVSDGFRKMNKSESEYHLILLSGAGNGDLVIEQPTRLLRFPNGDTYTPDFCVMRADGIVEFHEVKGGYRGPGYEQGMERFNRAAERFGCSTRKFFMAEKTNGKFIVTEYGGK